MCEGCVQSGEISRGVYRMIERFVETHPESDYGGGHIVFADCNVEDHHLDYCLHEQDPDPLTDDEREFLLLLRAIPEKMRVPNFWKEVDLNPTNVSPMGPRVLVKRLAEAPLKSSLIEVVQMHDEPSQFSVVLAVGKLKQGGIEVGDTVVTKAFVGAPLEVEIEGQAMEAFMLMESDCLAVVE